MNLFFSTPVWTNKIDNYKNVNEDIYKYILTLQKTDPNGIYKSNISGWHSKDFDLSQKIPKIFIQSIMNNIQIALNDMEWDLEKQEVKVSNMWAIINQEGAFNQKHQHGNCDLSAAYYVSAHEGCGDIVFYDPRPAPVFSHPIAKKPNILNATINSVSPQEGMLVLFPSYLEHSVKTNLSNKQRVVISFNLNLKKK